MQIEAGIVGRALYKSNAALLAAIRHAYRDSSGCYGSSRVHAVLLTQGRATSRGRIDITYIPTADGWLYLAAVMDLFSRKIGGWAMRDHMQVDSLRLR